MHFSIAFASLLTVSTALATPIFPRQSNVTAAKTQQYGANRVTVILRGEESGLRSRTTFEDVDERQALVPRGQKGPFTTVEIAVDEVSPNQDLRCQILDNYGKAVIATRGENTDITFSDADGGPWTFLTTTDVLVSKIICDSAFVKAAPGDFDVIVILQNQRIELGTQTTFEDFIDAIELPPTGSSGPFSTVELRVGALVDPQTLRCAIFDLRGRVIPIVRGGNRDTSFADGDGGLWTFVNERRVSNIVCDSSLKALPTPV